MGKNKFVWFVNSKEYQELYGIDGESVEFEWNIFPDRTILEMLHEIQVKKTKSGKQEFFWDRTFFMSMCNDFDWPKGENNLKKCISNSTEVKNHANRFPKGHGSFLGPGTAKTWFHVRRSVESISRTDDKYSQRNRTRRISSKLENYRLKILLKTSSSIEKSKAKVNEQLDFPLTLEDVKSTMKTLETDVLAYWNRVLDHQEKFENLSKETKVTQTCDIAGIMRKITYGQCFRAIHDVDDGFG